MPDQNWQNKPGWQKKLAERLTNSWQEKPHWALLPWGFLYGGLAKVRRLWAETFAPPQTIDLPVVALGNLTVGGTGKTPLTLALAQALITQGYRPAVLTRGYGRQTKNAPPLPLLVSAGNGPLVSAEISGDEPWLMAAQMPGLMVIVDPNRFRGAQLARNLSADILLLDDGWQQLKLATNCRILLLPAELPFGNGAVLPAGPLREFPVAHRRAHILVTTSAKEVSAKTKELAQGRPCFAADYLPGGWLDLPHLFQGQSQEPASLTGSSVVAFCGLGRPSSFERTLRQLGIQIAQFHAFPDHHIYDQATLTELEQSFTKSGAEFMVTTAKDAVKLPPTWPWPVKVLQIDLRLNEPTEFLATVIKEALE